jgi:hypothetical protein
MTLIEKRHPRLARLQELWRSQRSGTPLPPASALAPERLEDLAELSVFLTHRAGEGGRLEIARSGAAVDALYGAALAGEPVQRLGSAKGNVEQEAFSAIETARPVLIEEEMVIDEHRRRIARLYLPLANDDGSPDGVLCGVIAAS